MYPKLDNPNLNLGHGKFINHSMKTNKLMKTNTGKSVDVSKLLRHVPYDVLTKGMFSIQDVVDCSEKNMILYSQDMKTCVGIIMDDEKMLVKDKFNDIRRETTISGDCEMSEVWDLLLNVPPTNKFEDYIDSLEYHLTERNHGEPLPVVVNIKFGDSLVTSYDFVNQIYLMELGGHVFRKMNYEDYYN